MVVGQDAKVFIVLPVYLNLHAVNAVLVVDSLQSLIPVTRQWKIRHAGRPLRAISLLAWRLLVNYKSSVFSAMDGQLGERGVIVELDVSVLVAQACLVFIRLIVDLVLEKG